MRRTILLVLGFLFLVWAVRSQAQISQGSSITGSSSSNPTAGPTQTPTQTPTPIALSQTGGFQDLGAAVGLNFNSGYHMPPSGFTITLSSGNDVPIAQSVSSIYTVKNLYCTCQTAPGGGNPGNTASFIYHDAGAGTDTALKCSMQGAATTCNDTADSYNSTVGHIYTLKLFVSPGATPTSTYATTSCTCSVGP